MTQQESLNNFELLSRSWQEIKSRFAALLGLACVVPAVTWLLKTIFFGTSNTGLENTNLVLSIILSVLFVLLGLWGFAALVLFVCKRTNTIKESFFKALPYLPRLFGFWLFLVLLFVVFTGVFSLPVLGAVLISDSNILLGLTLLLVFPLYIVATFATLIFFALTPYVLILSNTPFLQAFSASYQLIRKRFWKTCGYMLLLALISVIISIVAGLLLLLPQVILLAILPSLMWITTLIWSLVSALISIAMVVPLTAFYLNACYELGQQIQQSEENAVEQNA